MTGSDGAADEAVGPSRRWLLGAAAGSLTIPALAYAVGRTTDPTSGAPEQTAAPATTEVTTGPGEDATVVDGNARFQVLTPTLLRLEYDADGRFEDRPTFVAIDRDFEPPDFETRVVAGGADDSTLPVESPYGGGNEESGTCRVVETDRLTLRYERGSGPFSEENLSIEVQVGDGTTTASPTWPEPNQHPETAPPEPDAEETATGDGGEGGQLGGWYRALDNRGTPRELHPGLLSRDGWRLIDDSSGPLLAPDGTPTPRPEPDGAYQDGYFFGYGHRYRHVLGEFADLTGSPPMLPRNLFGIWFSKWAALSAADLRNRVERFREEGVPLSVLVVDTDYKSPHSWNGWNWNESLFPDPEGFLDGAHDEDLLVPLNVHPSIDDDDPQFPEANGRDGGRFPDGDPGRLHSLSPAEPTHVFDWANPAHRAAYEGLHEPFEEQGVDFWWFDWCCDASRSTMRGVPPDSHVNAIYATRQRDRGRRGFVFSRIGASFQNEGGSVPGPWAEHRQTLHFTGDTRPTWEMLDFAAYFTHAEGAAIGLPYVSHDIGSFHGSHLPDDMYVRWVQLGTFQPICRLHSNHGDRLPWQYSASAGRIAGRFLRLRAMLVPYLYTLAREAHDTGLPMCRALYLHYPDHDAAYEHAGEYLLGEDVLVAPVTSPEPTHEREVWFPPGEWVDLFTGERHRGPATKSVATPLERMPAYARAGSVVPRHPAPGETGGRAADPLELRVYTGADGSFGLYEDAGAGLGYRDGSFAWTTLEYTESADSFEGRLTIEGADGWYSGQPETRAHEVVFEDVDEPSRVWVSGRRSEDWTYDADRRRLAVHVAARPTAARTEVAFR